MWSVPTKSSLPAQPYGCRNLWQQAFIRCDVTVYYGVLEESAYQSIPTCNLNFSSFPVCVVFKHMQGWSGRCERLSG